MIYTGKPAKASIYDNRQTRYTVEKIKFITGADIVFNGGLFDMRTYKPNCDVKVNGKVLNKDPWAFWGYGWNNGELPKVVNSNDMGTVENFISCLWAIHNGEKQPVNDNDGGMGGTRGRTAFGFKADGTMVIICTSDSNGAMKLSTARDKLYDAGCVNAIILDGGGSSQIISPDNTIKSSRIVSNLICVWLNKPQKGRDKVKVCLDPGHGTGEMNQSPDGRYIEHEFALDMANRIRTHLVRCGVDVKLTREDSSTPSLTARANTANTWGADLYVSLHSNAVSNGWNDNVRGLTVWTYAAGGERDRAAKLLLAEMKVLGIQTFGTELYHDNFAVLRETTMPAYLTEYAFHTSRPDVELLKSNAHRDKLAKATAKAICAWGGVQWIETKLEPTKPKNVAFYRVQVGAFETRKAAENFEKELQSKGYKTIIQEVKA